MPGSEDVQVGARVMIPNYTGASLSNQTHIAWHFEDCFFNATRLWGKAIFRDILEFIVKKHPAIRLAFMLWDLGVKGMGHVKV